MLGRTKAYSPEHFVPMSEEPGRATQHTHSCWGLLPSPRPEHFICSEPAVSRASVPCRIRGRKWQPAQSRANLIPPLVVVVIVCMLLTLIGCGGRSWMRDVGQPPSWVETSQFGRWCLGLLGVIAHLVSQIKIGCSKMGCWPNLLGLILLF